MSKESMQMVCPLCGANLNTNEYFCMDCFRQVNPVPRDVYLGISDKMQEEKITPAQLPQQEKEESEEKTSRNKSEKGSDAKDARVNQRKRFNMKVLYAIIIIFVIILVSKEIISKPAVSASGTILEAKEEKVEEISADGASLPTAVEENPVVTWTDPLFEQIIRQRMDKPSGDIMQSELDQINTLHILGDFGAEKYFDYDAETDSEENRQYGSFVKDGVEYKKGRLENLTDISKLRNLKELSICCTSIQDLTPLAELRSLKRLNLSSNIDLKDITPLKEMTQLEGKLSLWRNDITDISPICGLSNITDLQISSNNITDISAIASMTGLKKLNLYKNQISDISALEKLNSLDELAVNKNCVSDISAISNLTQLKILKLNYNEIENVEPLYELDNLEQLFIGYNKIPDSQISMLKKTLSNCVISASNQSPSVEEPAPTKRPSNGGTSPSTTGTKKIMQITPGTKVFKDPSTTGYFAYVQARDSISLVKEYGEFYQIVVEGVTCYVLKSDVIWKNE